MIDWRKYWQKDADRTSSTDDEAGQNSGLTRKSIPAVYITRHRCSALPELNRLDSIITLEHYILSGAHVRHKWSGSKGQQWSDESESSHQWLCRHWRRWRLRASESLPFLSAGESNELLEVKASEAQSSAIPIDSRWMARDGSDAFRWAVCTNSACVQERQQQLAGGVKKKSIDRWKRVQFIPSKGDGSDAADTAAASSRQQLWRQRRWAFNERFQSLWRWITHC